MNKANQLYLFRSRRFVPLFVTQFCGAFNDNLLKNALIILITYTLATESGYSSQFLVLLANAIFILPFAVFAGIAGQIADKFERTHIIRIVKIVEVFICMIAIKGFWGKNLMELYTALALMGVHSTFFGPIKYSILPDHLSKNELLSANGYIEAGTFLSILFGTIGGGFYNSGASFVLLAMLVVAIIGLIASMYIPLAKNSTPSIDLNPNFLGESINIMRHAYSKKIAFLAILGISWFWFIGAAFLAQIPSLTRDTFGADETVANLFLATFSVGVGIGSLWCSKLFENEITTKYVYMAAMGLSIFGIDLFFASRISAVSTEPEQLKSIFVFLSKRHNWRIVVDLFCLAAISGLYVVPLYAVLQAFTASHYRSRIIAANNIYNALFMIASTGLLSVLFAIGFTIPWVILVISILNIVVARYIYRLIPDAEVIPETLMRALFRFIFDKLYRVEIRGMENFKNAGKRSVIVANHISYIDPALLAVYLPGKLTFAINTQIAQLSWVKPFLSVVKTHPVDPANPMAIKSLIDEVKQDKKIAIFPEGRISSTGSLMKIYEGPGMIADKADATILPVRIDGPQYTHFSKMGHIAKSRIFPKVVITILPPEKIEPNTEISGRIRRKMVSQKLYDIMSDMFFESSDYQTTLYQSLIDSAKLHGMNKIMAEDVDGNQVTYRQFLIKTFALGHLLRKTSSYQEYVGLMLPNSVGTLVTFFAMQQQGRIPAMINFTSGVHSILSACRTANIQTIMTSRRFIEKAELDELAQELEKHVQIIYLEDFRAKLNPFIKIKALVAGLLPSSFYQYYNRQTSDQDPAVIMFTSGTEGDPKAVILSHRNLQANRCQVTSRVDFNTLDIAFNALPMFHSFGLTGAILMSLTGVRMFLYPSPLHYRVIPEMIYDIGATIMFATDTFLNGYAKYAHPYDFYSLRYVFAGAEKLKAETRRVWFDRFGVRIFEGYGATEAAPVISVNTPMHDQPGSVGRLMPKLEYQIEPVEGIEEGGKLHIKGPNVMLGYIKSDKPGKLVPVSSQFGDEWYDTGDIVKIDEDGYITILDRAKRFAKIGGEMVSLSLTEQLATLCDPEGAHASLCIFDDKRGEQIVLLSTHKGLTRKELAETAKQHGFTELALPKHILHVEEIPVMATGKVNYRQIQQYAEEVIADSKK